ncbi:hypothetical protein [Blautia sp.]|uniref:hypothetical protein n=1 Tax=Blautia sp. TaxID=1955243 RepID=UPI002E792C3A|nr:hypothetical protein [Blautia sp.]
MIAASKIAIASASGLASQIPVTPKMAGRSKRQIIINTKDLEKAKIAETTPLFNAVNKPLEKILKPIKNRAILQRRFPVTASWYTGLSGLVKILTRGLVMPMETATDTREITRITARLVRTNFFYRA